MTIIKIAEVFGKYPGGRYRTDGDFSAQAFREDILIPAFLKSEDDDNVLIDMSGTLGFGSSFLEEAFGGLARTCHPFSWEYFQEKLMISGVGERTYAQIFQYIEDAFKRKV